MPAAIIPDKEITVVPKKRGRPRKFIEHHEESTNKTFLQTADFSTFSDYLNLSSDQRRLITTYAQCGIMTNALKLCQITRQTHEKWCKESAEYNEALRQARDEAADGIEFEARRRAVDGYTRIVFYQGKALIDPITGDYYREHVYSDDLLKFLLKGYKPEMFGDNKYIQRVSASKIEHTHRTEQISNDNMVDISSLPPELRAKIFEEVRRQEAIEAGEKPIIVAELPNFEDPPQKFENVVDRVLVETDLSKEEACEIIEEFDVPASKKNLELLENMEKILEGE